MSLTIKEMQKYLMEKYKIIKPEEIKNTQRYFLKLVEEVGELAEAIRKNKRMKEENIKGSIEEELSDVLYYILMVSNTYDVDLEECFKLKEDLNSIRYGYKFKIDSMKEYEKVDNKDFIGKKVKIIMDRPMGSKHPKWNFIYPINYGYVPNTVSGDEEELDAYVIGVFESVKEYEGKCIGIVHRLNEDDDKLVIAPEGKIYTKEQIEALVEFQEKYFEHVIIEETQKIKDRKELKYIFFDWGYTLISKFEDVDGKINDILEKYNLRWDDIFKKWKNYQILNSLGRITEREIYKDLSLLYNISEEDVEKIDMLLLESHILDDETRDTIVKLYEKGYYLGIISNNSIRNVEYILDREGLRKYFQKIVISEEVKERKPNLKVYMKAFDEIPKEEYNKIAFVSDELLEDLLGVKMLGVKTIWYEKNVDSKWKKKEEVLIEPDYRIKSIKEIMDIL